MGKKYGIQVLFYSVKQSLAFTNPGLGAVSGTIILNGTSISVSDMSSASVIETAINNELGAGTVDVSLVSETFTLAFQTGHYHDAEVYISTTQVAVTDTTTETADNLIAEQTGITLTRRCTLAETTNKGGNGWEESTPITKVLEASLQNIFTDSDANYQFLRDAKNRRWDLYVFVKSAHCDLACRAVITELNEPSNHDDVVHAEATWKSTGGYWRVT